MRALFRSLLLKKKTLQTAAGSFPQKMIVLLRFFRLLCPSGNALKNAAIAANHKFR